MLIRWVARVAAATMCATLLLAPNPASAADGQPVDGSSPLTAAGSCWEIKDRHPSSSDGRYWIVTPAMKAPMQIYCDQTTNGGGWEMIARGRERWVESGDGTIGNGNWVTELPIDGRNGTMIAKQLPGSTVDALLDNKRVDSLSDGIRLRRATNSAGTSWQEVRFAYAKRDRWTWAMSALHPVSSYSVNGSTTTIKQTIRDLQVGNKDDVTRLFTFPWSGNNYARGFNFGLSGPTGSSSSTSYLYSTRSDGRYATPFTQMFIRPKLTRDSMDFGAIGDAGTDAVTNRPIASSQALPNTWGVKGLGAGGTSYLATEVSAFAQIGNTMYVGGNFTKVRNNSTGAEYSQPYLAAFNATTGAWISSFRPKLNNQVKALTEFRGKLVVGGQFTQVNGATRRALVQLHPTSGATYGAFKTNFTQSTGGAKLWVRSLTSAGPWLYVGGGFTGVSGGSSSTIRPLTNLTRVIGSNGTPQASWTPNLGLGVILANGKRTVSSSVLSIDLSADGATLFAAGQFTTGYVGPDGRNQVAARGSAAVNVSNGTLRSWTPRYSSTVGTSHYQQTVKAVGSSVWLGGSQHSLVTYNAASLAFQRGHLTRTGGDFQAIASDNGVVYGSCHCNEWTYSDTLAYDNNANTGFTQADRIGYVGAWDANTGDYLPQFAPTSGTRGGEGPWALQAASNGTLWAGGDYTSVVTTNLKSEWAGGFVRFAPTPSTAPAAPTKLTAHRTTGSNYAYFSWAASSTAGVSYELLKDNRVIQTMGPGDTYSDTQNYQLADSSGRFFVRAVDAAGNRSASTPVVKVGGPAAAAAQRTAPEPAPAASPTELVGLGSLWTVAAPGPAGVDRAWNSPTYAPTTDWDQVTAPIGWGNDRVASPFDDRPGTFYLRRNFTVDDPAELGAVTISTLADDGTAIYVNGVEVGRKNLPNGTLDGSVLATATPDDSSELGWTFTVPTSLLVKGRNVVSAEVHSGSTATKDVAFELQMSAK